jgi:hypothetical protein
MTDIAKVFRSESLQVAGFIHAIGALKLIGVETVRPGKLRFVFADDNEQGAELERRFYGGGTVSASALFKSQRYLRQMMSQFEQNENQQRGIYDSRNDPAARNATPVRSREA